MAMYEPPGPVSSAPTHEPQLYPETDGKPMAASDEHRHTLMRILRALATFFSDRPEVYVSGDILMYYVEGDPRKVVSPDVLVSLGIGQKTRRTYRVWEEGKPPDFVMELASETTYERDLGAKKRLYASLGVRDYFLCDIEGLYLPEPLMGWTLDGDVYRALSRASDGGLLSSVLGLKFYLFSSGDLRFYIPALDEWLLLPEEIAEARAERAEARAERENLTRQQAEARAEQEAFTRRQAEARAERAEAELAELQAELRRLRRNTP